jgi:hypothetical protein
VFLKCPFVFRPNPCAEPWGRLKDLSAGSPIYSNLRSTPPAPHSGCAARGNASSWGARHSFAAGKDFLRDWSFGRRVVNAPACSLVHL